MSLRAQETDSMTDWRIGLFGAAVEVNPRRKLVPGKEYRFIPMEALSTTSPNVTFTQRRVWDRSSGSKFQNGDVLLARITPSAENGKTALVNLPDGVGFGSTEFIVLSPKKGGIEDSGLLYYLVKFERIRKQAIQRMIGSTGRQRIPPEALDDIMCPIPPIPEQKKIAAMLSTVDEAIQKTDEIIAKTQQLKKGLMQRLLTKGIGHSKFKQTEIGDIPEEWEVEKLGDILVDIRYGTSVKANSQWKGFPILGIPNVIGGEIEEKDLRHVELSESERRAATLEDGDILIVRTNANPDYIGRCALFENRKGTWLYASYLIRIRADSERVLASYLSRSLQSETVRKEFLKIARTSAGNYNVNTQNIRSIVVCLPQLVEQKRIVSILAGIDEKIGKENEKQGKLENLKKGLMQVLFTGKVRVKVN